MPACPVLMPEGHVAKPEEDACGAFLLACLLFLEQINHSSTWFNRFGMGMAARCGTGAAWPQRAGLSHIKQVVLLSFSPQFPPL